MPHSPLLEAPQLRACQRVPWGVFTHTRGQTAAMVILLVSKSE